MTEVLRVPAPPAATKAGLLETALQQPRERKHQ
jgi:hypothetical protein